MAVCRLCGLNSEEISEFIGVCVNCLRNKPGEALRWVTASHKKWRRLVGLPDSPPRGGLRCTICANECGIPDGERGYCGVITNRSGRLSTVVGGFRKALLHWYLDPHPTNCVAGPVCPEREHQGYHNLAVFFAGCNLDCLFCQNVHHKYMLESLEGVVMDYEELAGLVRDRRITCVCYFGGDPAPNAPYALMASRKMLQLSKAAGKPLRICWETNGLENPMIMREMARLSLESGGIVKVDWKAFTPSVYQALTGIDGAKAVERLKENVKLVAELGRGRDVPLLVVSTLVVPHYVDEVEVGGIARYLAGIDPEIPYVLLAFAPEHLMLDVPTTSRKQMERVYRAAKDAGLRRVFIGNRWLLR